MSKSVSELCREALKLRGRALQGVWESREWEKSFVLFDESVHSIANVHKWHGHTDVVPRANADFIVFAANHIKQIAERCLELEAIKIPGRLELQIKSLEAENQKLKSKFKDALSMLDTLMEEARSLRDTESIELESFSAAEELVIVLSRTDKEELQAREALKGGQGG